MAYYVLNLAEGGRALAAALLDARLWGIEPAERHRDEVSAGDEALIYVSRSKEFIGRARIATAAREWTPSEAGACPDGSSGGVSLADVEEWDPGVTMDAVVRRIDPTASNPYVQANAAQGFPFGVVQITEGEYGAAVALSPGRPA